VRCSEWSSKNGSDRGEGSFHPSDNKQVILEGEWGGGNVQFGKKSATVCRRGRKKYCAFFEGGGGEGVVLEGEGGNERY